MPGKKFFLSPSAGRFISKKEFISRPKLVRSGSRLLGQLTPGGKLHPIGKSKLLKVLDKI